MSYETVDLCVQLIITKNNEAHKIAKNESAKCDYSIDLLDQHIVVAVLST
jgi:hypothetical protein